MKILHVFGAVVAVHVAAFVCLIMVPGCRSTGGNGDKPTDTTDVSAPAETLKPVALPADSQPLSDDVLNPAVAQPSTDSADIIVPSATRYSPTRPDAVAPLPAMDTAASVEEPTAPTTTYTVVKGDSLWSVAKHHGVSVSDLAAANNLSTSAILHINQSLVVPNVSQSSMTPAKTTKISSNAKTYTVATGDTLGGIARRFGTTVNALRALNNIKGDLVRVGQDLLLPEGVEPTPANATVGKTTVDAGSYTHEVKPGETLGGIARKYGVSIGTLATANKVTDPTRLQVGQKLVIPGWKAPAEAPVQKQTTPQVTTTTPQPLPSFDNTIQPTEITPLEEQPKDLDEGLDSTTPVPVITVKDGAPAVE